MSNDELQPKPRDTASGRRRANVLLACAVALAALKKIHTPAMYAQVETRAEALRARISALAESTRMITGVRGRGLMLGAVLAEAYKGKAAELSEAARAQGVLVLVAGPDVLRFVPPLTITPEEITEGMDRLAVALGLV